MQTIRWEFYPYVAENIHACAWLEMHLRQSKQASSKVTKGQHPLARFVVLSLMDVHRVPNVARRIRRFSSHPDEALAWVL